MPEIAGMPEGLVMVRFGAPKEDEFELLGDTIRKGVRPNAVSGMIVAPAPGYTLQPQRLFDIREYVFKDGEPGVYTVVKQFETPASVKVSASFTFIDANQKDLVIGILDKLKDLPGCAGVEIG